MPMRKAMIYLVDDVGHSGLATLAATSHWTKSAGGVIVRAMKRVGELDGKPAREVLERNAADFFETWAPLRKFRKPIHDDLGNRSRPSIHMHCPTCASEQTYVSRNDPKSDINWYVELFEEPWKNAEMWRFVCMGCRRFGRLFFIESGEDERGWYQRKLGQKPEWEAAIEPELDKLLGAHAKMFRRGLDCEGTGYGIGAYGYYRRVVEDMIGGLLEQVPAILSESEMPKYAAALAEVRTTTVAQTKIALVKDLLPSRLLPAGINPLDVLHSELSSGLHGKTDEECLDDAVAVREALAYLVIELGRAEAARKTFTEGMRKILEKRGGGEKK